MTRQRAEATFEAAWTRAGLAHTQASPGATLRAPEVQSTGLSGSLPRLSIGAALQGQGGAPHAQIVVRELLGEGGMGVVHLARQPLLDRDVAIKRIRPDAPAAAGAGLLREARYMGSLEHPNIVPVHALGADDEGRPVLVMKRIEGTSWARLLEDPAHPCWGEWAEEEPDPVLRHVEILLGVCRAVAYAHDRGVVHRDLKPDNVQVDRHGEVYVLDWGIAARLGAPALGGLVGTPAYMPPEMARLGPAEAANDIYLLGGCLFHVLAGRPPHPGGDLKEVLQAAWEGRCAPIPEGASPELVAICRRALAPEPADRWPSVAALQRALDRWRRTRGLRGVLEAAEGRLEALKAGVGEGGAGAREVLDAVAACRFGFSQVLEHDPQHAGARAGLQAALSLAVSHALDQHRLGEAELWVEELAEAGGEVGALRARLERARVDLASHRALARDYDLGVAAKQRTLLMGILAVAGIGVSVAAALGGWGADVTPADLVGVAAAFLVLCLAAVALTWRWMRANAVNRAVGASLVGAVVLMLLHRVLAWQGGATAAATLSGDLLILSMFGLVAGLLILPWLMVFSAIAALGAIACALSPDHALSWFGLSTTTGLLTAIVSSYRGLRPPPG